jgi:transcriptional regulator with XRE-family HTH domain
MQDAMRDLRTRVATNVTRLREARDWSQEDLAEYADTTGRQINRIENGRANLSLDLLARIAHSFGENPAVLLSDAKSHRAKARTLTKEQHAQFDDAAKTLERLRAALSAASPRRAK